MGDSNYLRFAEEKQCKDLFNRLVSACYKSNNYKLREFEVVFTYYTPQLRETKKQER